MAQPIEYKSKQLKQIIHVSKSSNTKFDEEWNVCIV